MAATMTYLPGQRWVSETEPELGLGLVVRASGERVLIAFQASGEQREYAIASAPLRRVVFRKGEKVTARSGLQLVVRSVEEENGLLTYRGENGQTLSETELSDTLSFGSPKDRLLNGRVSPIADYNLRQAALVHQHHRRKSPIRGFVGGRMDLIPHQLYIAHEVTRRHAPRVLLADEVGLGKTVEAGLIIHRLLAVGRVSRVLVVVPESLVHQWFVELLRRFNLWFHIFDEARCAAIEAADPEANPFLDDQWVLCALPLLLQPKRAKAAIEAGWDLLVVDEAHHLRWSPDAPSPEYQAVEALSQRAEGVLLLTATPEQLGLASHFARLRLLDPDRYGDFARFEEEARSYRKVAQIANKLIAGGELASGDRKVLREIFSSEPAETRDRLEKLAYGDAGAREELVRELLDRHGPGRVMFRNTRAAMQGFPRRLPQPVPLTIPESDTELFENLAAEFEMDLRGLRPEAAGSASGTSANVRLLRRDPRMVWLAELLRSLPDAKFLLIARTKEKVLAIDEGLKSLVAVPTALFHEDLELVQRDRHAAWFAEPEGARILLASEIGSEGRNFQFAHHLVLFDLPLDPELLEQRIGRLDRIGQKSDIHIHIPHVLNSAQEVLFRWFHEGLDAFGHNLVAGRELLEQFGETVRDLALDFHETHDSRRSELDDLIAKTRSARIETERRLEEGRDRLLELNSYRPTPAAELAKAIAALDQDPRLEDFLLRIWDHYGVPVEDIGHRAFKVGADGIYHESFPGLPAEGMVATLDRTVALGREDLTFLTWDHPMVTGALDLLLGGADGSSSFAEWPDAPQRDLWLEATYVLECIAPARLHADRFLPATPVRICVDARQREITSTAVPAVARARLRDADPRELLDNPTMRQVVEDMAEATHELAQARAKPLVEAATRELEKQLTREIERLKALAAVNPAVRPEELAAFENQRAELRSQLASARLRLDSVRLILLGE